MNGRVLVLSLVLGAAACERLQQAIEDTARDDAGKETLSVDVPDPDEHDGLSDEERLTRKLALYIACLDRSRGRIQASWARYVDDIDPDTGVPRRKGGQPFLQAIDKELDPCHEAEERGGKLNPPLPAIEAAMSAYLQASTRFAEHTRALHHYYETKTYEEDGWERGKEIAPDFASAHESWSAAARELSGAVSEKRDRVEADMLALIETREGKSLRWHANNLAIVAKKFRTCVEETEAVAKDCQQAYDALHATHEAFRAHHDAHATEAAKVFWMLAFETTAEEYLQEAAALMRGLSKMKPKAKQDAIEGLVRLHDDLASDHANLKFDFP